MKIIRKLSVLSFAVVSSTLLLTSCDQNENELTPLEGKSAIAQVLAKTTINSASLSGCSPTNNILFDSPINNLISPTNKNQNGMSGWKKVNSLSDEFNYTSKQTLLNKWKYGFVNNYTGPPPTLWSGDQVSLGGGELTLTAQETGSGKNRRLKCGMITSKASSSYPLYQEARVKVSNSSLANAVWMLSDNPGTTEEIDNLEAYGPRLRPDGTQVSKPFFADRLHLSHHTFQSSPRLDYQPKIQTWMSQKKSNGNCNRTNDVVWSQKYHIYGVKWVSATKLEYYVDGKKVKTVDGLNITDGIDPQGYTKCNGLKREMRMLISQAAQHWRYGSIDNFWNSPDIKSGNATKMRIDWIRVFTPTGTENRRSCN
ncbi:hypothetical protein [Polaribacter sp. Q13]|uniref:hypothetical protein n=1 Tax=Polaribacter sp. Q13 TaxID=2806551 RepID=UPI00193BEEE7|nr:hypothetical protein [Polaribacter sp. Q13]QVY66586.1 hypothetical protein JOP69_04675 [Polaribacter sp. Q13]